MVSQRPNFLRNRYGRIQTAGIWYKQEDTTAYKISVRGDFRVLRSAVGVRTNRCDIGKKRKGSLASLGMTKQRKMKNKALAWTLTHFIHSRFSYSLQGDALAGIIQAKKSSTREIRRNVVSLGYVPRVL